ncbi:hypothetical protein [Geothrix sp. 21YS21S-4]|uniref:hypothetical protein n=1 Tax=Geothrix sp. 21YS21S-4 TaxID=3068889 RepID=UPI0027B8F3CA|nr:hypothetical protein [Geothrix sp. 21YS21S-4]
MAGESAPKVRRPLLARDGVVRAVKFIPRMVKPASESTAAPAMGAEMICSGHCGRCRCNPCRLHTPA